MLHNASCPRNSRLSTKFPGRQARKKQRWNLTPSLLSERYSLYTFCGHQSARFLCFMRVFEFFLPRRVRSPGYILRLLFWLLTPTPTISRFFTEEGAAVPGAAPRRDQTPAPGSVMIRGSRVFSSCLLIVMLLTKRLPVASIPEEFLITSMRCDMIHDGCLHIPTFLEALLTKGMLPQEQPRLLLPPASVTTS